LIHLIELGIRDPVWASLVELFIVLWRARPLPSCTDTDALVELIAGQADHNSLKNWKLKKKRVEEEVEDIRKKDQVAKRRKKEIPLENM
jgi:hypothetical protein